MISFQENFALRLSEYNKKRFMTKLEKIVQFKTLELI